MSEKRSIVKENKIIKEIKFQKKNILAVNQPKVQTRNKKFKINYIMYYFQIMTEICEDFII